ncbi:Paired amphipathic helix protein Sin3a [Porphyridium purpureum]|uniref:Paired amphipathic helix protein Sin3a n=1 Tax=Porphyridium purpureum TaxID=35688 RepID=A0A5J4Z8I2_PORPP|nr:Paired amphipathic helix protein Sin3a [Porphyridium purpureum]|eukprot:POR1523..scf295_1
MAPGQQALGERLKAVSAYVQKVSSEYSRQPRVLEQFRQILDVMNEELVDAENLASSTGLRRALVLFSENDDLTRGLSVFMPPGYSIQVQKDARAQRRMAGYNGPSGSFTVLYTCQHPPAAPVPRVAAHVPEKLAPGKDAMGAAKDLQNGRSRTFAAPEVHMSQANIEAESRTNDARPSRNQDATAFADKVKAQFSDQPTVYEQYCKIMEDFRSGKIGVNGVIKCVILLFRNHINLLVAFNSFMPPGYHISESRDSKGVMVIGFVEPSGAFHPVLHNAVPIVKSPEPIRLGSESSPHASIWPVDATQSAERGARMASGSVGRGSDVTSVPTARVSELPFNKTVEFLEKFALQFKDQEKIHLRCLEIAEEFKARKFGLVEVIRRLNAVLVENRCKEHKMRIESFNQVLPPELKVLVSEDATTGVVSTSFRSRNETLLFSKHLNSHRENGVGNKRPSAAEESFTKSGSSHAQKIARTTVDTRKSTGISDCLPNLSSSDVAGSEARKELEDLMMKMSKSLERVQEQKERVEIQRAELDKLKTTVASLVARLQSQEATSNTIRRENKALGEILRELTQRVEKLEQGGSIQDEPALTLRSVL